MGETVTFTLQFHKNCLLGAIFQTPTPYILYTTMYDAGPLTITCTCILNTGMKMNSYLFVDQQDQRFWHSRPNGSRRFSTVDQMGVDVFRVDVLGVDVLKLDAVV